MPVVRVSLPEIRHDFAGFQSLVRLHAETKDCFLQDIVIDMSGTRWFDADMSATLGALLHRLGNDLNSVKLTGIPPQIEEILSKNGFLSHYGREQLPDRYGTTISYQRFDAKDDRFFAEYVAREFVHRSEIPKMSSGLRKRFRESVFEVFSNAVIHSQTALGIFGCGQFFPKRNKLDFSVCDLGIGICQNVRENAGLALSPTDAIRWATLGRNTTKRDGVPGGLGLKLLGEFIDLNGGRLQIVSDSGYWRRHNGEVFTAGLEHSFPGTLVSLEINTADPQAYALSSELSETDIF